MAITKPFIKSKKKTGKVLTEENVFLTQKTLAYLAKAFKYGEYFQAHPYKWNEEAKQLELVTSKTRFAIWLLNVFISYAYYAFLICQLLKVQHEENTKIFVKVFCIFMFASMALLPCNQMLIILQMKDIPLYFNHSMEYTRELHASFVTQGSEPPKIIGILEMFVLTLFTGLNLNIGLGIIISIFFPDLPSYPSSVVADVICLTDSNGHICIWQISALIVSHIVWAHVLYMLVATSLLLALSGIPSVFHILVLMSELHSKTCRITKNGLRQPDILIRKYRELQVYVSTTSRVYSFGVTYNKLIILFVCIYSLYGALKFDGLLAVLLGVTGLNVVGYLTVLFTALAELHSRSTSLHAHWSANTLIGLGREAKYFHRCLMSMPILKMNIQNFYYVDKPLILTMFQFVLESLADLLILYP